MAYTLEMKRKLEQIVQEGVGSVRDAVVDISHEFDIRQDYIAKPEQVRFDVNGGLHARIGDIDTTFTNHSKTQLFSKIGMPGRFYDMLTTPEKDMPVPIATQFKQLAAQNIEQLMNYYGKDGLMFRVVDGMTKGVLSPSYGRHDASPIFEAFMRAALAAGYVPYKGHNTTNRYQITYLLPELIEIGTDEYLVFTITITTSDYGAAANSIEIGVLRVWCTNLAVGLNMLRKVHIGQRFVSEDSFMRLSETTHTLDVKAISSAVYDIVQKSVELIPTFKDKLEVVVREGSTQNHQMTKILERVRKDYGKEIFDSAKALYDMPGGIETLPKEPGLWRMSNVLSLLAQSQPADLRLDLQKEAFNVLQLAA